MYEFYRKSVVGKALVEAVDEKVRENLLTPTQANHILEEFDMCIPMAFNKTAKNSITFYGKAASYNHISGVWKFLAENLEIYLNNEYFISDAVRIVACDADISSDVGGRKKRRMGG